MNCSLSGHFFPRGEGKLAASAFSQLDRFVFLVEKVAASAFSQLDRFVFVNFLLESVEVYTARTHSKL
jgi:hypothetical protein